MFLALEYARKHSVVVFFDVDYRPYTWESEAETAVYYNLAAEKSDVIIGTREEFDMMEKLLNYEESNDQVTAERWFSHHAKIVVIKHGEKGRLLIRKTASLIEAASLKQKCSKHLELATPTHLLLFTG